MSLWYQERTIWVFSPTTRKVESKKLYNRRRSARVWKDDSGMSAFFFTLSLYYDKSLRIQHVHKSFIRRAGYPYRSCRPYKYERLFSMIWNELFCFRNGIHQGQSWRSYIAYKSKRPTGALLHVITTRRNMKRGLFVDHYILPLQ